MSRTQSWALGGGVVFLLQCLWFRHFQVDDAFITYRYARNWAAGLGPVMNAGERVEGVSNLPWTAVLALLDFAGLEPHEVAPILGVLCGLTCVVLATRLGMQWSLQLGQRAGVAAGVLLAACAPIAIWSVSGLETSLYVCMVTLFLVLATHSSWKLRSVWLGILLAVVACMRPEGILLLMAWMVSLVATGSHRAQVPRVLLGFALVAVPFIGLRLWFYADWLPNTVHAKSSLQPNYWIPGLTYVAKSMVSTLPLWGLAWVGWRSLQDRPLVALAGAWVVLQLLFVVVVGGERFPGYRFLVPTLPILAVLAVQAVSHPAPPTGARAVRRSLMWTAGVVFGMILVWKPDILLGLAEVVARNLRLQESVTHHEDRLLIEVRFLGLALVASVLTDLARVHRPPVAVAVAVLWLLVSAWQDVSLRACRQPGSAAYHGRLVGEWLRQHAPVRTWVATNSAGALPYFSGLPVIDMLGLTDAHIARSAPDQTQWIGHERGDGQYVLQRRPDIVILGGAEGSETPWTFPGDQQIAAAEQFQQGYERQRVRLEGFDFTYYRARDGRMPPLAQ